MKRAFALFAVVLLPVRVALSQASAAGSVEAAKSYSLPSAILHENRIFDVTLPKGYARQTSERYPVLYVLDGEFQGKIASAIAGFYADASMLPNAIVVAVRNVDRVRDMTPAPIAGFDPPPDRNGGANNFLQFF